MEVPEENPISRAAPTELASEIVDLRDSINALFSEWFQGGRMLALPQERSIVQMFQGAADQASFGYLAVSLGNLAGAITSDVRRALSDSPAKKELRPLEALGMFLEEHATDSERKQILDPLHALNRLRRLYPVHTDRGTGVVRAHGDLGMEYPVQNHADAAQKILTAYRDGLRRLLQVLKRQPER